MARSKNYFKTFDEENVNFKPIAHIEEIQAIEKEILSKLDNFRMRGRTGRKNEWLENIKPSEVEAIAKHCIVNSGLKYDLLI